MKVRLFKFQSLEEICENYGQSAMYLGTIPEMPHQFILDNEHLFRAGEPVRVCGNTIAMLGETRFARHFHIYGDRPVHSAPFASCNTGPISFSGDLESAVFE